MFSATREYIREGQSLYAPATTLSSILTLWQKLADQLGKAIDLIQFRDRGPTDHFVRAHGL